MMAVFFSLKIWEESTKSLSLGIFCQFFGMLLILKYFYCFSAVFYLQTARQAEAKDK